MTRTLLAALLLLATPAFAADLPTPSLTPGAVLTTDTATICARGYARTVRHTPAWVKAKAYAEYGIRHHQPDDYEVDHLVSLELGGADELKNLWPQSYKTVPWNARVKDRLENYLRREVCAGRLPLATAQAEIARDWIGAYRKYLGDPGVIEAKAK
jgi:hypothetical protein